MSNKNPYFKTYEDNYDLFDNKLQHYVYDLLLNRFKRRYGKQYRIRLGVIDKIMCISHVTTRKALQGLHKKGYIDYEVKYYGCKDGLRRQALVKLNKIYVGIVDNKPVVSINDSLENKLQPYTKEASQKYYMYSGLNYKEVDFVLKMEKYNLWGQESSYRTLAKLCGCTAPSIGHYVNKLVELGWLKKERVHGGGGFLFTVQAGMLHVTEGLKSLEVSVKGALEDIRKKAGESTYQFIQHLKQNAVKRDASLRDKLFPLSHIEFRSAPLDNIVRFRNFKEAIKLCC